MAEQVTLAQVSKAFAGRQAALPVLSDVSLTIPAGTFLAVLGPSGCGKSTLLRLVAGLEQPSAGTVRLGARVVTQADPRCAVVFQEPRLFPWLSVAANIAFGARRLPERVSPETLLSLVGLSGFQHAYPHQLSGGMAQRAALARALIGRPEVLLLDEPFAALDALTRMQMQDLVADVYQRLRPTIVLVTHDVDEALYLADRIVILGRRPSTIAATIDVPLSRPRDRGDVALAPLRAHVLAHFGLSHAAHSAAAGSPARP
ncbi:MAG TPA: ABC transporter ATP-binding protein [Roseiflexaceae bacterium]|nr:ABC transporter ATP-binding protein [Roseiflexaceae bacterium]